MVLCKKVHTVSPLLMFKALQISWLTPIAAAQKRSGDVMLLSQRAKGNHKADVSSVGFLGAVLSLCVSGCTM